VRTIPNGRKFPSLFDPIDGRETIRTREGNPTHVGGASVVLADDLLINAEVAWDPQTMEVVCPNVGNRRFRQRDHEIVVAPTRLYSADGQRIQAADRSELFGDEPFVFDGSNPHYDFKRLADYQGGQKKAMKWLWEEPVEIDCTGALIMAGDTLYAGGQDTLSAIDARSREVLWTAELDGLVYGLAAADGRLFASTDSGAIYCYSTQAANGEWKKGTGSEPQRMPNLRKDAAGSVPFPFFHGTPASPPEKGDRHRRPHETAPQSHISTEPVPIFGLPPRNTAADEIIRESGIRMGYCLDLGCGDGSLAAALARKTDLFIFAVDTAAANVAALREEFRRAGLYGVRVLVEQVDDLAATGCPAWFANLVVSGRSLTEGADSVPMDEARRVQRPHGGVLMIGKPGAMQKIVRGPLPGEGLWTHQYADPGNTSCSGDRIATTPLCVRWFGGPSSAEMPHAWGFIACRDGVLFGTEEGRPYAVPPEWMSQFYGKSRSQGKRLFALELETGKLLWSHTPRHSVIRDSIAIGRGKVFFIDGLVPDALGPGRREELPTPSIVSLEMSTGKPLWDDPTLMYNIRPVIVDDTIISQHTIKRQKTFTPSAWDLETGRTSRSCGWADGVKARTMNSPGSTAGFAEQAVRAR